MSTGTDLWRVSGIAQAAFVSVIGAGEVVRVLDGGATPQILMTGDPEAIRAAVQAYGEGASVPARRFARRMKELGVYVRAAERDAAMASVATTREEAGR